MFMCRSAGTYYALTLNVSRWPELPTGWATEPGAARDGHDFSITVGRLVVGSSELSGEGREHPCTVSVTRWSFVDPAAPPHYADETPGDPNPFEERFLRLFDDAQGPPHPPPP